MTSLTRDRKLRLSTLWTVRSAESTEGVQVVVYSEHHHHMAVEKARTMVSQNVVKKEVTTTTKNIGKLFQNDGENIRKSC